MAGLRLVDIHKSYGKVEVIKGTNLEIAQGEFVVFVGPSGCGKSTLLRMIAGLEDITGGELYIGDELVLPRLTPAGRLALESALPFSSGFGHLPPEQMF